MIQRSWTVAVLGAALLAGCNGNNSAPQHETSSETATSSRTTSKPAAPDLTSTLFDAVQDTNNEVVAAQPAEPAEEPEMVAEVAAVGVGKKGRGYGGGIVTEPVRAYFRTGQRIAFDITIPQAMKMYRAMDPQGKGPKSHEEFMQKIIRENGVDLPMLPDGHRYRYDPETEELLVEHPRR